MEDSTLNPSRCIPSCSCLIFWAGEGQPLHECVDPDGGAVHVLPHPEVRRQRHRAHLPRQGRSAYAQGESVSRRENISCRARIGGKLSNSWFDCLTWLLLSFSPFLVRHPVRSPCIVVLVFLLHIVFHCKHVMSPDLNMYAHWICTWICYVWKFGGLLFLWVVHKICARDETASQNGGVMMTKLCCQRNNVAGAIGWG